MRENFIGPPNRDFDQLFRLAEGELSGMRVEHIDPELLVAICVNASQGNGFYCCSPRSYQEAMNSVITLPKFNTNEFLDKVTPRTGFRKGQMPKFEFVKKNWHCAETMAWRCKGNETDGVIMACNWGLPQLPAVRLTELVQPQYKLQYLQAYLGDVNMQMRELIRVLVALDSEYPLGTAGSLYWLHVERVGSLLADKKTARDHDLAAHLRTAAHSMSP